MEVAEPARSSLAPRPRRAKARNSDLRAASASTTARVYSDAEASDERCTSRIAFRNPGWHESTSWTRIGDLLKYGAALS